MTARIECESLVYRYGRRTALHEVTASLGGGITGVLGPNGAGKSTLLSLLSTARRPSAGRLWIGGHDVANRADRERARRILGYLPQRFELAPRMTVLQTAAYAAWAAGVDVDACERQARVALGLTGLEDLADSPVRRLSGGQRQRLGIAAVLSNDPEVLILDEPTVGLDPTQRVNVRRHLQRIAEDRTVVISTHLIEDVAWLCDRIIVLCGGVVRFSGSAGELRDRAGRGTGEDDLASPLELAYEQLLADGAEVLA